MVTHGDPVDDPHAWRYELGEGNLVHKRGQSLVFRLSSALSVLFSLRQAVELSTFQNGGETLQRDVARHYWLQKGNRTHFQFYIHFQVLTN